MHLRSHFKLIGISFLNVWMVAAYSQSVIAADADQAPTLTLDAGAGDHRSVSPTFYGLMTEEINHSYDGGLYAELIQNRAFNDDQTNPVHWELSKDDKSNAAISLDKTTPVNDKLPVSLKLEATSISAGGQVGVCNEGFWGIPVKPDTTYRASFYIKATGATGPLTVSLISQDGSKTFASAEVEKITDQWQHCSVTLKTAADITASFTNKFQISTAATGTYWFGQVSLFPPTWHDRPNGNRTDLMQLMADLHPSFLRCPGGNYLEGYTVDTRFNWKQTIGSIDQRPGHMGTWGYRSSDGLGLLEFLEWAEDIGGQPVLAVYGGFSLPGKQHKSGTAIPAGEKLQPFVDEALEEIEYAVGDEKTKWGAQRIADGHPKPFPIQYVEIGNEDFTGDATKTYNARFAQFFDAIKAKYPQLKCIATVPVKGRTPDLIDDHYYKTSDQMAELAHKYDKHDRSGPKVFVGEWATREIAKTDAAGKTTYVMMPWGYKGGPTPTFHAALGDAAFMTGLERNADVVLLNCYAPMLTRVEPGAFQWCPNMIGYNSLESFASPSYYAQQMFSLNRGDQIIDGKLSTDIPGFFFSTTKNSTDGTIYLKAVNRNDASVTIAVDLQSAGTVQSDGELTQMTSADPQAVNSIQEPKKVVPVTSKLSGLSGHFSQTFPGNSVSVLKIKTR